MEVVSGTLAISSAVAGFVTLRAVGSEDLRQLPSMKFGTTSVTPTLAAILMVRSAKWEVPTSEVDTQRWRLDACHLQLLELVEASGKLLVEITRGLIVEFNAAALSDEPEHGLE